MVIGCWYLVVGNIVAPINNSYPKTDNQKPTTKNRQPVFLYFSLLIFYTSPRQWGLMGCLLFAKVELKRHTNPLSQINKKIRLEAYTEQSESNPGLSLGIMRL